MQKLFNKIPNFHGKSDEDLGLRLKQMETAFALYETLVDLRLDMVVMKFAGTAGK